MTKPVMVSEKGPIYRSVSVAGAGASGTYIDYAPIVPEAGRGDKVDGVSAVGLAMRYIDPDGDGRLTFDEMRAVYRDSASEVFDFLRYDMIAKYPPYETMRSAGREVRMWDNAWYKLAVDLIAWKHGVEIPNETFEVGDGDVAGDGGCEIPAAATADCRTMPFSLSRAGAKCFLKSLAALDALIARFLKECHPGVG